MAIKKLRVIFVFCPPQKLELVLFTGIGLILFSFSAVAGSLDCPDVYDKYQDLVENGFNCPRYNLGDSPDDIHCCDSGTI